MESVSKILYAISAESRAAADRILENGRNNAAEMRKLSDREAQLAEERIIAEAEKTAGEIRQRSISQAGIESRNIRLKAKREALTQAFDKAGERLAGLAADQKKELYQRLILKYSSSREVNIQLNEADKKAFGSRMKADGIKVRVDDEAGSFSGGLIIREKDIETNCTFEVILEAARKEMETEIAAVLFS